MNMLLLVGSIFAFSQPYSGEKLSRGLIGIPTEDGMYFSWRMTLEDAAGLQFDLYRSSGGGAEGDYLEQGFAEGFFHPHGTGIVKHDGYDGSSDVR